MFFGPVRHFNGEEGSNITEAGTGVRYMNARAHFCTMSLAYERDSYCMYKPQRKMSFAYVIALPVQVTVHL